METTVDAHAVLHMFVPSDDVGAVIGKGGEAIKSFTAKSKVVNISVMETAKLLWCPVQVHGALPCVAQAYELIAAVVDDVDDVVLDVVPCHDARTPTAAVLQRCREISASTGVRISFPGVHTRLSVLLEGSMRGVLDAVQQLAEHFQFSKQISPSTHDIFNCTSYADLATAARSAPGRSGEAPTVAADSSPSAVPPSVPTSTAASKPAPAASAAAPVAVTASEAPAAPEVRAAPVPTPPAATQREMPREPRGSSAAPAAAPAAARSPPAISASGNSVSVRLRAQEREAVLSALDDVHIRVLQQATQTSIDVKPAGASEAQVLVRGEHTQSCADAAFVIQALVQGSSFTQGLEALWDNVQRDADALLRDFMATGNLANTTPVPEHRQAKLVFMLLQRAAAGMAAAGAGSASATPAADGVLRLLQQLLDCGVVARDAAATGFRNFRFRKMEEAERAPTNAIEQHAKDMSLPLFARPKPSSSAPASTQRPARSAAAAAAPAHAHANGEGGRGRRKRSSRRS